MKLVAVAFLVLGVLCNSTLAVAEGPIPFSALAKNGGNYPMAIPLPDTNDNATAAPTQTPPPTHMTTGGKVMTGVGIGLIGVGTFLFIGGLSMVNDSWFGRDAAPIMGAGAAFGGGGTVLIVLGSHRRTTK